MDPASWKLNGKEKYSTTHQVGACSWKFTGEANSISPTPNFYCMLMEVHSRDKLKLSCTSCGCMLMEVDWGGKLVVNSMVDLGTHGTNPKGHNISEVDGST